MYRFGPFRLDPLEHRLWRAAEPLELPPKAFDVLLVLVENAGHLVQKEDLLARVWPDTAVEEGNLSQMIYLLRKTLDDGEGGTYIETVPRKGYRFVALVERSTADAGISSRQPAKWLWIAAGAMLASFTVGLAGWFWLGTARAPMDSIAVLPLQNLSGMPEQEYFTDGMTDALITDLAQIRKLRVISRTSVMTYKNSRKPLRDIARELGVRALVEGSVQRSGSRIKITAQLIDAATDSHLWARAYEDDAKDVLELQNRVARAIAGEVHRNLTTDEKARLSRKAAVSQPAYEEYLEGNYFLNKRSPKDILAAISHYESAIRLAPEYASGHAGLSNAHTLMALNSEVPDSHRHAQIAKAEALRSVASGGNVAAGYTALAAARVLADYDWAGSESDFRRAVEIDPNDAQAHHWYASLCLLPQSRFAEALDEMEKARLLDPVSVLLHTELGYTLDLAGKDTQALAEYQRALAMDPNFIPVHFRLEQFYGRRRQPEREIEQIVQAERLLGNKGLVAEAEAALRSGEYRAVWLQHASPPMVSLRRANARARLGQTEQALDDLEQLYAMRDPFLIYIGVELTTLRDQPRYQQLLRKIGLKR